MVCSAGNGTGIQPVYLGSLDARRRAAQGSEKRMREKAERDEFRGPAVCSVQSAICSPLVLDTKTS